MSVHYKFVLDKRRKRDDKTYPLKLRIYDNDGNKEKSLDIYLHEDHWDDKGQLILPNDPSYKSNNYRLTSAKNKVERKVMLAEDEEEVLLPEDIISSVTKKVVPKSKATVRQFSDELIANMKLAGKAGTAMAYQDAMNSIISFSGNESLQFEDITYKLLVKYNTGMLVKGMKKNSKGLKVNAIAAYMRSIRAIYNKAIKAEVVEARYYPFLKFTIETEETISRTLTLAEIRVIVERELKPDTPAWHNRNYFILSFCLIGMNFADMLTLTSGDILDGRVVYRRNKTGRIYNIGMHPKVQELIQYYKAVPSKSSNKFVLPMLQLTSDALKEHNLIKQVCKNCSKHMKRIAEDCGIVKNVSTYWARYTWANLAKKELHIENSLIADALGHQYGNKVTGIYLDSYSNETIDEANRAVIELVFGK
ncbi:MAG: site-specific integrase [Taibaiella sp.]|nr:site-specific integrase [Taibaiella sp.]